MVIKEQVLGVEENLEWESGDDSMSFKEREKIIKNLNDTWKPTLWWWSERRKRDGREIGLILVVSGCFTLMNRFRVLSEFQVLASESFCGVFKMDTLNFHGSY